MRIFYLNLYINIRILSRNKKKIININTLVFIYHFFIINHPNIYTFIYYIIYKAHERLR